MRSSKRFLFKLVIYLIAIINTFAIVVFFFYLKKYQIFQYIGSDMCNLILHSFYKLALFSHLKFLSHALKIISTVSDMNSIDIGVSQNLNFQIM